MQRYIDADLIYYNEICVPMLDGMIVRTKKLDGLYAQQKYIEKIPTADVQEDCEFIGKYFDVAKNTKEFKCDVREFDYEEYGYAEEFY